MSEANCFHCKKLVVVQEAEKIYTNNGRLRLTGKCGDCQKKVSRFISDPSKPALTSEEKKIREQKRREEKKKERELHPELESQAQKSKAKKRRITIGNIELSIVAQEVSDENVPKRRKLTLKEKREKEIKELKEKNEKLLAQIKDMEDEEETDSSESDEEMSDEKEEESQSEASVPQE